MIDDLGLMLDDLGLMLGRLGFKVSINVKIVAII
jgi:hypothetical protein